MYHCQEAMYWCKVMPKDDVHNASAPANALYQYEVRVKGIDEILPLEPEPEIKRMEIARIERYAARSQICLSSSAHQ